MRIKPMWSRSPPTPLNFILETRSRPEDQDQERHHGKIIGPAQGKPDNSDPIFPGLVRILLGRLTLCMAHMQIV
jgi:hypothetical protein